MLSDRREDLGSRLGKLHREWGVTCGRGGVGKHAAKLRTGSRQCRVNQALSMRHHDVILIRGVVDQKVCGTARRHQADGAEGGVEGRRLHLRHRAARDLKIVRPVCQVARDGRTHGAPSLCGVQACAPAVAAAAVEAKRCGSRAEEADLALSASASHARAALLRHGAQRSATPSAAPVRPGSGVFTYQGEPACSFSPRPSCGSAFSPHLDLRASNPPIPGTGRSN